jgi:threonyl-tRNA synthetase
MIHRSIIGSVERAVAYLIEAHGGAFPGWLAPVQLVALPISDAETPAAAALVQRCIDQSLRAELAGPEYGTLGARIRAARLVPYQAIIGSKEVADDQVALRMRDGRRIDALPVTEALARISALTAAHSLDLWGTDAPIRSRAHAG